MNDELLSYDCTFVKYNVRNSIDTKSAGHCQPFVLNQNLHHFSKFDRCNVI